MLALSPSSYAAPNRLALARHVYLGTVPILPWFIVLSSMISLVIIGIVDNAAATTRRLRRAAILRVQRVHARALQARELEHAIVVRVIHEIRDWIRTRSLLAGARVAPTGAAVGSGTLRSGIAHLVTRGSASTLERVIQAQPMSHLMRAGIA